MTLLVFWNSYLQLGLHCWKRIFSHNPVNCVVPSDWVNCKTLGIDFDGSNKLCGTPPWDSWFEARKYRGRMVTQ